MDHVRLITPRERFYRHGTCDTPETPRMTNGTLLQYMITARNARYNVNARSDRRKRSFHPGPSPRHLRENTEQNADVNMLWGRLRVFYDVRLRSYKAVILFSRSECIDISGYTKVRCLRRTYMDDGLLLQKRQLARSAEGTVRLHLRNVVLDFAHAEVWAEERFRSPDVDVLRLQF